MDFEFIQLLSIIEQNWSSSKGALLPKTSFPFESFLSPSSLCGGRASTADILANVKINSYACVA